MASLYSRLTRRKQVAVSPAAEGAGLARVLGLMCRHKADYSPVLPFLVADLVTLLQTLPVEQRGLVTTALYPLLDLMEKHSFSYLSANLSPSANELFKVLLDNYNSSHRFRGKV